ncbi:MAG: hypothetical protein E7302_12975 [Butyrivibrio sp.]|nr:hypothetical protein [Butyrivibrio sp.]
MSEETSKVTVNNEYKDRLFNFIFGSPDNRKWTLSLYNAINGSDYTDENAIEFNTIEEALYLGMHNDTSFLISDIMNVYEHQSSFNPNMPLRQLQYLGSLYEGYITKYQLNKYGKELIKLPVPKLVVFYNGLTNKEDESLLKLSDSFDEAQRNEADVQVRVKMLNINYGHNKELMEACRPLYEYSWFIDRIRYHLKSMKIENALNKSIDEVPDDFVLKQFLKINKSEVFAMLLTEYNEDEVHELFKLDGIREGIDIGADKRLIGQICKKLKKGKDINTIADEVEEEVETITPIVEVAKKHSPDYDVDTIFNELYPEKGQKRDSLFG